MKKSFGQHFLHDKAVIEKIVDAVHVGSGAVVEVGPGEGALTRALLERVAPERITLIEADRDLIPKLEAAFPGVTLVHADAAKVDFDQADWVLVANLPYNAAAAILRNAFVRENAPREAVVMVQKEQADRMRAKPGEMSLLSVFIQLYSTPKKVFDVGSGAFRPPPNVDSTVLQLIKKPGNWQEHEKILQLAKAGFASRRKQLQRNLADAGYVPASEAKDVLRQMGLRETVRAQELSIDDWKKLQNALDT